MFLRQITMQTAVVPVQLSFHPIDQGRVPGNNLRLFTFLEAPTALAPAAVALAV
jgi:hypothetical protein